MSKFNPELRRRLSEISRGKPASQAQSTPEAPARVEYAPSFAFTGSEEENEHGKYFVSDYKMADLVPETKRIAEAMHLLARPLPDQPGAPCPGQVSCPTQLLFLDLETCGLSSVPVFLIGTMRLTENDFEIRQFFARDYSEERSILLRITQEMASFEGVVTFNGKTFDVPFLRNRMTMHKVRFSLPRVHHDLIHGARRKWRRSLPDCRLQTLESIICGRHRSGDVPGGEIPGLYHEYVRTGDITPLIPVFKHNVLDLMTMAELFPRIIR